MLTSVTDLGIQFHTEINGRPSGLEHSPADGSGQSIRIASLFSLLDIACYFGEIASS